MTLNMLKPLCFIIFLALSAAFLCPVAAGQTRPTAQVIAESGNAEGMLYSNKLLGFTILAPGTWHYFSKEQNDNAHAAGRDAVRASKSGLSQAEQAALDRSIDNTQIMFQATPLPLGEPGNAAIFSCGIERLQTATTLEKYAQANKKMVLMTPSVKITKDIYPVTFNGVGFSGFETETSAYGKIYRQKYLVTIRRSVALFFVTTIQNNKYDQMLDYSLKTIRFGK